MKVVWRSVRVMNGVLSVIRCGDTTDASVVCRQLGLASTGKDCD